MTTLTYPVPPPTVNNLDAQARTRLLRSTRKLGVVLGATPFLVEVTSPTASSNSVPITPRTKAYRREGRFFGHSPSSSISSDSDWDDSFLAMDARGTSLETSLPPLSVSLSIESPTKTKSSKSASKKPLAQPLLLRLRSVPIAPARSTTQKKAIRPLPPTPLSPAFSYNSTSIEGDSPDKERDARRKKMAKLTRTLGENIPPELVFPTPPSSSRSSLEDTSPSAPPKPRSKSISKPKAKVRALPPPPASAPTPTTAPSAQLRPTLAERRNQRRPRSLSLGSSAEFRRAVAMTHAEQKEDPTPQKKERKQKPAPLSLEKLYLPPVPQSQPREPPTSLKDIYTPPKLVQPPPRSTSISTKHRHARSSPSNIIVSPPQESQGRTSADGPAFSTMEGPSVSTGDKITRPQPNQGQRKEREWSGEWSHEMDEVVRRLRTLGR